MMSGCRWAAARRLFAKGVTPTVEAAATEAFVWLTDMAGLSREEAAEVMRTNARTLVRSALEPLESSE
jgi:hypothetical protein